MQNKSPRAEDLSSQIIKIYQTKIIFQVMMAEIEYTNYFLISNQRISFILCWL